MISIGIDPGTKQIGWCVCDVGRNYAAWKDGGTWKTSELDRTDFIPELKELVADFKIEIACVEIARIHKIQAAKALTATNLIGGRISGFFEMIGVKTVRPFCSEARKAIFGKRGASDNMIRMMLHMMVHDAPRRTNNHARDAAVMAIYGARTNEAILKQVVFNVRL